MNAKKFRLVLAAMFLVGLLVVGFGPTFAHHPIVSGSAVCNSDGNWEVTWVVENGNWSGRNMTLTSVSRPVGGIQVGAVVAPNGSVSGTETLPGSTAGTDSLVINASWSNGGPQNVTGSAEVTLPEGGCKPPVDKGYTVDLDLICEPPTYEITIEGQNVISVEGELNGALGDEPKTVHFTVHFSDGSSTPDTVSIPAKGECGEPPPLVERPATGGELTFPCINPTLGEGVFAARWILPDHSMVGSWQWFQGKELTLTFQNAMPGDVFEFRKYPDGTTLAEARGMNPETAATLVGTSTVSDFANGIAGHCTPNAPAAAEAVAAPCPDCPPAVCLLVPGTYVAAHNQWVGLYNDGAVSIFTTENEAKASGLTYAGSECGLCAVHLVNVDDQTVFITEGSTAYDIAVAINLAEGSPAPNFLNRHMAQAEQALANWRAADKAPGRYSYSLPE